MGIRIKCAVEDPGGVAIPVVRYLVVIVDMYPGQILGSIVPVWTRIDAAILLSIVFGCRARPARNVDVDEITKEDHELRLQVFYCLSEEFESGVAQWVPEGDVWEVVLEA